MSRYLVVLPDRFADTEPCRAVFPKLKDAIARVISHRRAGRFARLWDYAKGEWVTVATPGPDAAATALPDPD